MKVTELNRSQLTELKQNYLAELVAEGTFSEIMGVDRDEPSYDDLLEANELISDEDFFSVEL